jgi:hypothetical protein
MAAARPNPRPRTPRIPRVFRHLALLFAVSRHLAHLPRTLSKYGRDEHHWRIRSKTPFFAPILDQTIPGPHPTPRRRPRASSYFSIEVSPPSAVRHSSPDQTSVSSRKRSWLKHLYHNETQFKILKVSRSVANCRTPPSESAEPDGGRDRAADAGGCTVWGVSFRRVRR